MTKTKVPNVVRGGKAIPIKGKTNYYYMAGRKHTQGGIDIGKNPRTGIEVEDGEVMHLTNNEVKVFSSVPFLNGESPAEKVMRGNNPDKVFKAQEAYKRRNNINDDGTKKKRMGGVKARSNSLYSVTVNGKTKLKMFPSTGERPKAFLGLGKKNKKEKDNKHTFKDYIKDNKENLVLDGMGLISNLAGSIIANRTASHALGRMSPPVKPTAPVLKRAAKLKTRININPQLSKMAESVAAYEREVDNNTTSSQVALARKQRARSNAILMANELYGNKENAETSLINQDRLNQQSVANANVDAYNAHLDKVNAYENARVAFENDRILKKAENNIGLINNINAGIQDVIGKTLRRRSENKTIATMALANPNLPIETFHEEGIISKRLYDAYRKAYPNKKKNTNG